MENLRGFHYFISFVKKYLTNGRRNGNLYLKYSMLLRQRHSLYITIILDVYVYLMPFLFVLGCKMAKICIHPVLKSERRKENEGQNFWCFAACWAKFYAADCYSSSSRIIPWNWFLPDQYRNVKGVRIVLSNGTRNNFIRIFHCLE